MNLPPIAHIQQNARRGLRIHLDHILFRNYRWQPHLEIQLMVESVRHLPLQVVGLELMLSYNAEQVGPLPPLPKTYDLIEPGEGIEIRLRKDLYPTLAEALQEPQRPEDFFQLRGVLLIGSPSHSGLIEVPIDTTYTYLH